MPSTPGVLPGRVLSLPAGHGFQVTLAHRSPPSFPEDESPGARGASQTAGAGVESERKLSEKGWSGRDLEVESERGTSGCRLRGAP